LISPINGLLIISNGFIPLLDFGRRNPPIGFTASNTSGSLRTRTLKLKLIYLGIIRREYPENLV